MYGWARRREPELIARRKELTIAPVMSAILNRSCKQAMLCLTEKLDQDSIYSAKFFTGTGRWWNEYLLDWLSLFSSPVPAAVSAER